MVVPYLATNYALPVLATSTINIAHVVHTWEPVRLGFWLTLATLNTSATGSFQVDQNSVQHAQITTPNKHHATKDHLILSKRAAQLIGGHPKLGPLSDHTAAIMRDFGLRVHVGSLPRNESSNQQALPSTFLRTFRSLRQLLIRNASNAHPTAAEGRAKSTVASSEPVHESIHKQSTLSSFKNTSAKATSARSKPNSTSALRKHSPFPTPHVVSALDSEKQDKNGIVQLEGWAVLTVADVGAPIQEEWRAAELVGVRRWTLLMLPRGYLGRFCIDMLIARAFFSGYMPGLSSRPKRTKGADFDERDETGDDDAQGEGKRTRWPRMKRFLRTDKRERGKRDRRGRIVMGLVGLEMMLLMMVKFGVQFLLCNPIIILYWKEGDLMNA